MIALQLYSCWGGVKLEHLLSNDNPISGFSQVIWCTISLSFGWVLVSSTPAAAPPQGQHLRVSLACQAHRWPVQYQLIHTRWQGHQVTPASFHHTSVVYCLTYVSVLVAILRKYISRLSSWITSSLSVCFIFIYRCPHYFNCPINLCCIRWINVYNPMWLHHGQGMKESDRHYTLLD